MIDIGECPIIDVNMCIFKSPICYMQRSPLHSRRVGDICVITVFNLSLVFMFIVDGGWGNWTTWTACSQTCDTGSTTRERTCDNPIPQYGGNNCSGNGTDTASCLLTHCPGVYSTIGYYKNNVV